VAKDGLLPFCNIYSAFSQRAYANIIHDAAILNLPMVLCLDRAGLVGKDGPTHHGAFDMAALSPIPNLTIASPMDQHELRKLMFTAQLPDKGTFVIRYPRGRGVYKDWRCPLDEVKVGEGRKLRDGKNVAVLSIGPIGNDVEMAISELESEGKAVSVAHYDMRFLKPIDENILQEVGQNFDKIVTIEDGVKHGGLGSIVLEWMSDHGFKPTIVRMGLPDEFIEYGKIEELRKIVGLDIESIKKAII
jgi:1-deoxy-D-xylulose-5-phosphate synthase